jgi:hypothetical protein
MESDPQPRGRAPGNEEQRTENKDPEGEFVLCVLFFVLATVAVVERWAQAPAQAAAASGDP